MNDQPEWLIELYSIQKYFNDRLTTIRNNYFKDKEAIKLLEVEGEIFISVDYSLLKSSS